MVLIQGNETFTGVPDYQADVSRDGVTGEIGFMLPLTLKTAFR